MTDLIRYGFVACALLELFVSSAELHADDQPAAPASDLFGPLDAELFSDLPPLETKANTSPAAQPKLGTGRPAEPAAEPVATERNQPGLKPARIAPARTKGGDATGGNPLQQLADAMQVVGKRLSERDAAAETQQLQTQIVRDLNALIDRLQQQHGTRGKGESRSITDSQGTEPNSQPSANGPSSASPSKEPTSLAAAEQGDGNPGEPSAGGGSSAISLSDTQPGAVADGSVSTEQAGEWMSRAWGHLPATARQQMQSTRPEQFLPKYSRLIEDYFRRLAEAGDE